MATILIHGTSSDRLPDIKKEGLKPNDECAVTQGFGCLPGIYITPRMGGAAFFAAEAVRRSGGEAQAFLRTDTRNVERRGCCPHFDLGYDHAHRLTDCTIPPEDLSVCVLPDRRPGGWSELASDMCSGERKGAIKTWEPLVEAPPARAAGGNPVSQPPREAIVKILAVEDHAGLDLVVAAGNAIEAAKECRLIGFTPRDYTHAVMEASATIATFPEINESISDALVDLFEWMDGEVRESFINCGCRLAEDPPAAQQSLEFTTEEGETKGKCISDTLKKDLIRLLGDHVDTRIADDVMALPVCDERFKTKELAQLLLGPRPKKTRKKKAEA